MRTDSVLFVLRRRLALALCSTVLVSGFVTVSSRVGAHAATVTFDPILSGAPIEGYQHDPQVTSGYAKDVCFGRLRDGTRAAYDYMDSVFGWPTPGTMYTCREMINSSCSGTVVDPNTDPYFYSNNCWSNHAQGWAIDLMVGGNAPAPEPLARGNALVNWLLQADAAGNRYARARRLGIQQIIWNDRCWSSQSTADRNVTTASAMGNCNGDHFNHVHLDLTIAGANGQTSAYTSTARLDRESDYNGDGKADMMVYRPSEGNWYVRYTGGGQDTLNSGRWGDPGDVPLNGDYDGDGKADMMVFRPSTGAWHVKYTSSNHNETLTTQWGGPGDIVM
jgi:hypothetical protein